MTCQCKQKYPPNNNPIIFNQIFKRTLLSLLVMNFHYWIQFNLELYPHAPKLNDIEYDNDIMLPSGLYELEREVSD